ncbi:FadR family transcriptional regulator [Paenibacillus sp. N1-5-1-14]|uniref:FadR/GntR family transcriptional regulator n=1 Tax=Paenibacillus radicibacter TaxID=2972488 RepID=UPI0021597F27|nr:FadR/GntR family transcriptional regulator [Paenibacillus radicibacter]MCR8645532.1 FadR family transcriptional regulator [Paenibacillus radicibacter]
MSPQIMKPRKGYEIVMEHLKEQIMAGKYEPGQRLPTVVNLAASYDVGRSTIREALSALKAMGYIEIRHGGGSFVHKQLPTEEELSIQKTDSILEIIEARKFIESGCASLAAGRRTDQDLKKLKRTLDTMQLVMHDEEQSELADIEFHLQIAKASHNLLMMNLMESLHVRLQESMKDTRKLWFYNERATSEILLQEHRQIYEAIAAQDEQRASLIMMQHLVKVEKVVQKFTHK